MVVLVILVVFLFIALVIMYVAFDYYKNYTTRKVFQIYLDYIKSDKPGPYQVSLKDKYDINPPKNEHGAIVYAHYLTDYVPCVHPIRNTHIALAYYENYLVNKVKEDLTRFFEIVDAFIKYHVKLDNGAVIWYYPPFQFFPGQKVPYTSAMSQGQMLAVLSRAYYESTNPQYIELGYGVLKSFEIPIEEGGVCFEDKYGLFYEEFAYWEMDKRNHTLNGMLSALFGIYDFWKITNSNIVKQVFDKGVCTIRKNLVYYDRPFCSSYDLRDLVDPVNNFVYMQGHYNAVHVAHLKILAIMTDNEYFQAVADLWDRKLTDPWNRFRLTLWYLRFKSNDLRQTIKTSGLFKTLWINAKRFITKRNII